MIRVSAKFKKIVILSVLVAMMASFIPQPQQKAQAFSFGGILGAIVTAGATALAAAFGVAASGGGNTSGISLIPGVESFTGGEGIPQPLAVPTSVENPLQPGIGFNLKSFMLDLAKSFVSYVLRRYTDKYVGNFINNTLSKYKINDYLKYGINLADQVYVAQHMTGASSIKRYLTQVIIQDINNNPFGTVNLDPIFVNLAKQDYDFNKINQQATILDVYSFMARAGNLNNTWAGQRILASDYAAKVKADATWASSLSVLTGRGNKDSQICMPLTQQVLKAGIKPTGNNLPSDYETISYLNCAIENPGQWASQNIDARIMGLLGLDLKPQDHLQEFTQSIIRIIGNAIFGQQIISSPYAPISG